MLLQILLPILVFTMAFLAFTRLISQEMEPAYLKSTKHENHRNNL
jgi:hypothetical protein